MYIFDSRIRYSETDSTGSLSLEALLDYFQDCSTFHSEDVGVGVSYLEAHKKAWVLSSWQIVVEHFPKVCERVKVGTFPYDFKGYFGNRNFFMLDEEGNYLAKANTLWTLLDTESMRPTRAPLEIMNAYELEERLEMDYAHRKIDVPRGGEIKEPLEVRLHHLDTNHHVNNGQYVRMAMDFLPEDFNIKQMRAEYKRQALLHDELYPYVVSEDGIWTVSLCDKEKNVYVNVEFR